MPWLYILHFTEPIGHMRHYTGYTSREILADRLHEHITSRTKGGRLVRVAIRLGIGVRLGWTSWCSKKFGRKREARIKAKRRAPKLCNVCNGHPSFIDGAQIVRHTVIGKFCHITFRLPGGREQTVKYRM